MPKNELSSDVSLRVRYAETDQMGMVYYGRFAEYFEIGRVELIRSLGLTYDELETSHRIWMPVMSMQVRYIRPARYDQELRIRTSLRAVPLNDITFFSEIFNDENRLLCAATIKLCFLDSLTGNRVTCPGFLQERINHAFETAHIQ